MTRLPPTRPLILEIKGNSLDDGPGIRTVVFFKGCPLDCSWCHNPESKKTVAELSFDAVECVDCGECIEACAKGALSRETPGRVERLMCDVCGACVDVCPSRALSVVGRKMDVQDIIRAVEKDMPFFETSGGGVTLSGGEPTMFMDFCSRLLVGLEELGVHTIVETCGLFDMARFEEHVLPHVNSVYYDLKLIDGESHRRECGTPNDRILENFRHLAGLKKAGAADLLARVPLVPGITATGENLRAVRALLDECGLERVALLEYNPLWPDKAAKIGRPEPFPGVEAMRQWMPREQIEACRAVFDGLEVL